MKTYPEMFCILVRKSVFLNFIYFIVFLFGLFKIIWYVSARQLLCNCFSSNHDSSFVSPKDGRTSGGMGYSTPRIADNGYLFPSLFFFTSMFSCSKVLVCSWILFLLIKKTINYWFYSWRAKLMDSNLLWQALLARDFKTTSIVPNTEEGKEKIK